MEFKRTEGRFISDPLWVCAPSRGYALHSRQLSANPQSPQRKEGQGKNAVSFEMHHAATTCACSLGGGG